MLNDRSWIGLYKGDARYKEGVLEFLKFARENSGYSNGLYPCPCLKCMNMGERLNEDVIYIHLTSNGIKGTYTVWDKHGEIPGPDSQHWYTLANRSRGTSFNYEHGQSSSQTTGLRNHMVDELVDDAFPARESYDPSIPVYVEQAAMASYQRLKDQTSIPLYDGSTVSKLDALLQSLQLKDSTDMTNAAYDKVLKFVKGLLPKENNFPTNYREVKKDLKQLGMGYKTIHACVNGCMLFYKEYSEDEDCRICHASRWTATSSSTGTRTPIRTVRYFPLAPRLQRLYGLGD